MEFTNPTDWPGSMPELRTIDNLLRCSICYEFLNTAMILPDCSHNFCSLCIRRYLPQENKCPSCKKPASIPDLKNNRVLDELVKNFVAVRPHILALCLENDASPNPVKTQSRTANQQTTPTTRRSGRNRTFDETSQDSSSNDETIKGSPSKQSIITKHFRSKAKPSDAQSNQTSDDDDFAPTTPFRSPASSRPSTSKAKDLSESDAERVVVNDDNEDCMIVGELVSEGEASSSSDTRPNNSVAKKDKASCPVCGMLVNSKYINAHLDSCLLRGGDKRESKRRATPKKPKRKPLPKLVYNLMSDKEIRKKLKEFKLSHQGVRKVMIKRLQEYTLLYNAECDSANPKSVEAIIKEVEKLEKLKAQPLTKREESVTILKVEKGQSEEEMEKHQKDYLNAHKNQFDKLISDARARMKKIPRTKKKQSANQEDQASTSAASKPQEDNVSETITEVPQEDIVSETNAEVHPASETCSPKKQPVVVIHDLATETGSSNKPAKETGSSNKPATRKTRQKIKKIMSKESDIVLDRDSEKVIDQPTDPPAQSTDQSDNGKNSARVSLSFTDSEGKLKTDEQNKLKTGERNKLKTDEQTVCEKLNKRRSMSDLVLAAVQSPKQSRKESPEPKEDSIEPMDQGNSSLENEIDSIEDSPSPSLLCSEVVLGDAARNGAAKQQDNSMSKSGLLDTLMSNEDTTTTKPSGDCNTSAVLAPPSPSETSKAGDDLPIDQNHSEKLENSETTNENSMENVDCIPESPQPSTSGIRPRKRKKVEPAPSDSGSSVGDDFVGLRRSNRRAKKTKT